MSVNFTGKNYAKKSAFSLRLKHYFHHDGLPIEHPKLYRKLSAKARKNTIINGFLQL